MGRRLTSSLTAIAAALLLAACGGGSGTSTTSLGANTNAGTATAAGSAGNRVATGSASTPSKASGGNAHPPSSTGRSSVWAGNVMVRAVNGGFLTIIPSGYRDGPTSGQAAQGEVEYVAIGRKVKGFGTSMTIFRAAAGSSDLAAITSRAVSQLSKRPAFLPKLQRISSQQALRIDGEPAIAIAYELSGRRRTFRRQIFVVRSGWAYEISDQADPSRYAESLRALDEVIRHWRWQ
jgi:hypothetical protein